MNRSRSRAGFTLSRALFRKKCGGPSTGAADLFFLEKLITVRVSALSSRNLLKTGDLFCSSLSFHSGGGGAPIFLACKNWPLLLWGPFLWRPLFGRICWTCLNPPLNRSCSTFDCRSSLITRSLYPDNVTKPVSYYVMFSCLHVNISSSDSFLSQNIPHPLPRPWHRT